MKSFILSIYPFTLKTRLHYSIRENYSRLRTLGPRSREVKSAHSHVPVSCPATSEAVRFLLPKAQLLNAIQLAIFRLSWNSQIYTA